MSTLILKVFQYLITLILLLLLGLNSSISKAQTDAVSANSSYYLQINFENMRQSPSGKRLFDWVEDEIIEEIGDELGQQAGDELAKNLKALYLFGYGANHEPALVIEGTLSQSLHDQLRSGLVNGLQSEDDISLSQHNGSEYFTFANVDLDLHNFLINTDDHDKLYYAIGNVGDGQSLLTTTLELMQQFLDNSARLQTTPSNDLIVLQASNPLIQAGLDTRHDQLQDTSWESVFLKNVDHLALLVADEDDQFRLELQANTKQPSMASALVSMAQGFISLQQLSGDDDETSEWLQRLSISHTDNIATFKLMLPAEKLHELLD